MHYIILAQEHYFNPAINLCLSVANDILAWWPGGPFNMDRGMNFIPLQRDKRLSLKAE